MKFFNPQNPISKLLDSKIRVVNVGIDDIDKTLFIRLMQSLAQHHSIDTLILHDLSKCDDVLINEITTTLKNNSSLKKIGLYDVTDTIIPSIAESIAKHPTLCELTLMGENLTENSLLAICESLRNTAIKRLNLTGNNVNTTVLAKLTQLFQSNTLFLQYLGLSETNIQKDPTWGLALGELIKATSSLRLLDVHHTHLNDQNTPSVIEALIEAFKNNFSITECDYSANHLDQRCKAQLNEFLSRNKEMSKKNRNCTIM